MSSRSSEGRSILLVGERGNFQNLSGRKISWRVLHRIGAFKDGPSGKRLKGLGLEWGESINLLSPMPSKAATHDPHDVEEMRENAWMTLLHARVSGAVIVSCGQRATEALGAKYTPLSIQEIEGVILYVLPHPSGRNRWWNSNSELAKEFIQLIMRETRETHPEASSTSPPVE